MYFALAVLIVIAWGALAFGAVYDWAYAPLLAACAAIGLAGFARRVPHARRRAHWPLVTTYLLVAAAIAVQLVPLPRATIVELSPATDRFLREYNLDYAVRALQEIRASAVVSADGRAGQPQDAGLGQVLTTRPVSHPLSIDPRKTWLGLAFVGAFGLFFFGLARALDGRDLRVIVQGLAALGVLLALLGVIQKAVWGARVYGFWTPENANAQPFGPFINTNHYAGWMIMALPLVLAYFAAQVTRGMVGAGAGWRSRLAWFGTPPALRAVLLGFAALVMTLATALTLSRSGVACLVLVLLLMAAHVIRPRDNQSRIDFQESPGGNQSGIDCRARRGRRLWLAGYVAIVLVAALSWAGLADLGVQLETAGEGLQGRLGAWGDAWRIHKMFPVFGTGFNTYGTATVLLQQFQREVAHYYEAHNDYLQVLVEGGYLVTVPALALVIAFIWQARARVRERHDDHTGAWLRLGAITGIVAMALQETVEFSLQMPGNFALFAVLCAMAVRRGAARPRPSGSGGEKEARSKEQEARSRQQRAGSHEAGAAQTPTANPWTGRGGARAVLLAAAMGLTAAACGGGTETSAVDAVYSKETGRLELIRHDSNHDGRPDIWSYMDGTRILRVEVDRDFDGRVDRWEYYAADGSIEKVGFSRGGDGVEDAWAFQGPGGAIARMEISTRRDGTVSRWEFYEGGALARAEEDTDGDGRVDKWETYAAGTLATMALDTKKEGKPDRRLIYGPGGVTVERVR